MAASSHKAAHDLTHQQSDVLDYITEIAQELAHMAARAGCETLSHDLTQAILKAHDLEGKTLGDGPAESDDAPVHKR